MEIVKYILTAVYAVVCLALIVVTFKQNRDEAGASGTIMGSSTSNFYEKNKGRTNEGRLKKATIILMVAFAVLTIALAIVYVAAK